MSALVKFVPLKSALYSFWPLKSFPVRSWYVNGMPLPVPGSVKDVVKKKPRHDMMYSMRR